MLYTNIANFYRTKYTLYTVKNKYNNVFSEHCKVKSTNLPKGVLKFITQILISLKTSYTIYKVFIEYIVIFTMIQTEPL